MKDKKSKLAELWEDYAMLGGLSAESDLCEPFLTSIKKRLPWLFLLLLIGLLVSGAVGAFEEVTAELPLIVSFQSLILGMSGNIGTQSLAVSIRALTGERLTKKQKTHLVLKEARLGATSGLLIGGMSFGLVGGYLYIMKGTAPSLAFSVSFCTGAALLVSMTLSSLSGTLIPILFHKIKTDPAVASGPFITTVNDLVAVVTYYGIAWGLLCS